MGDDASELYIVVYGGDISLLKTRQWVLESGGFKVEAALDVEEAERLLRNDRRPCCFSATRLTWMPASKP